MTELTQKQQLISELYREIATIHADVTSAMRILENNAVSEELRAILEKFINDQYEKLFPGVTLEATEGEASITGFNKEEWEKFLEDWKKAQDELVKKAKSPWEQTYPAPDGTPWITPYPHNPSAPWITYHFFNPNYSQLFVGV